MKTLSSAKPEAEAFYAQCLDLLAASGIPFLLGGTFAVSAYTGLPPPLKDLDVFCKPGDYPRVLARCREQGFATAIEDERWIAKIRNGECFVDVIFNSSIGIVPVTEDWFEAARTVEAGGRTIPILAPTELVWSKVFLQDRCRYDGGDIAHVLLHQCESVDWRRLLSYLDQYWEVLLAHVINFRFVYPTERQRIPRWLIDELMTRLRDSLDLPVPRVKVCRGRLFSPRDYAIDVERWGFADLVGDGEHIDERAE